MMTHRGHHSDIGIGMVDGVKTPKERHRMLAAMHCVTKQVEQQKAGEKTQHETRDWPERKA
jgi:hypothetical protein